MLIYVNFERKITEHVSLLVHVRCPLVELILIRLVYLQSRISLFPKVASVVETAETFHGD